MKISYLVIAFICSLILFPSCGNQGTKTEEDPELYTPSTDEMDELKELLAEEQRYLDKHVFYGLTNVNNGFDAQRRKYFSEADFAIVLQRVKEQGLGIYGIEPWKDSTFYEAATIPDKHADPTDSNWYMPAFERFRAQTPGLYYSAVYYIPED